MLRLRACAIAVARTIMIAWREIVHVIRHRILFQLHFAAMHQPGAMLLLLLARRRVILTHHVFQGHVGRFLLAKCVHLLARLGQHGLRNGAVIAEKYLVQSAKQRLIRTGPFAFGSRFRVQHADEHGVHDRRTRTFLPLLKYFHIRRCWRFFFRLFLWHGCRRRRHRNCRLLLTRWCTVAQRIQIVCGGCRCRWGHREFRRFTAVAVVTVFGAGFVARIQWRRFCMICRQFLLHSFL